MEEVIQPHSSLILMKPAAVFATACFPTIEYISHLHLYKAAFTEHFEFYIKQTNRNRYHIASASGIVTLSVPVRHEKLYSNPVREVKISYDNPWQRIHWRTITASYNRSAFFEFFQESLQNVFFKKPVFLIDFNNNMLEWVSINTGLSIQNTPTAEYTANQTVIKDLRLLSDQKSNIPFYPLDFKKYPQVFETKYGFIPNLSILDLMFNTGRYAKDYLPEIR